MTWITISGDICRLAALQSHPRGGALTLKKLRPASAGFADGGEMQIY
jgi:hypothetical protein